MNIAQKSCHVQGSCHQNQTRDQIIEGTELALGLLVVFFFLLLYIKLQE